MPVKQLKNIIEEYCSNQEIHFLKIDVEGFEDKVLKGMDLSISRPWILCIEAKKENETWENDLINNNYIFALHDTINNFYVAAEKKYLIDRLIVSSELLNLYEVFVVKKDDEIKELQNMTNKISDSTTFKVGQVITYIPKEIKSIIKRIKKSV